MGINKIQDEPRRRNPEDEEKVTPQGGAPKGEVSNDEMSKDKVPKPRQKFIDFPEMAIVGELCIGDGVFPVSMLWKGISFCNSREGRRLPEGISEADLSQPIRDQVERAKREKTPLKVRIYINLMSYDSESQFLLLSYVGSILKNMGVEGIPVEISLAIVNDQMIQEQLDMTPMDDAGLSRFAVASGNTNEHDGDLSTLSVDTLLDDGRKFFNKRGTDGIILIIDSFDDQTTTKQEETIKSLREDGITVSITKQDKLKGSPLAKETGERRWIEIVDDACRILKSLIDVNGEEGVGELKAIANESGSMIWKIAAIRILYPRLSMVEVISLAYESGGRRVSRLSQDFVVENRDGRLKFYLKFDPDDYTDELCTYDYEMGIAMLVEIGGREAEYEIARWLLGLKLGNKEYVSSYLKNIDRTIVLDVLMGKIANWFDPEELEKEREAGLLHSAPLKFVKNIFTDPTQEEIEAIARGIEFLFQKNYLLGLLYYDAFSYIEEIRTHPTFTERLLAHAKALPADPAYSRPGIIDIPYHWTKTVALLNDSCSDSLPLKDRIDFINFIGNHFYGDTDDHPLLVTTLLQNIPKNTLSRDDIMELLVLLFRLDDKKGKLTQGVLDWMNTDLKGSITPDILIEVIEKSIEIGLFINYDLFYWAVDTLPPPERSKILVELYKADLDKISRWKVQDEAFLSFIEGFWNGTLKWIATQCWSTKQDILSDLVAVDNENIDLLAKTLDYYSTTLKQPNPYTLIQMMIGADYPSLAPRQAFEVAIKFMELDIGKYPFMKSYEDMLLKIISMEGKNSSEQNRILQDILSTVTWHPESSSQLYNYYRRHNELSSDQFELLIREILGRKGSPFNYAVYRPLLLVIAKDYANTRFMDFLEFTRDMLLLNNYALTRNLMLAVGETVQKIISKTEPGDRVNGLIPKTVTEPYEFAVLLSEIIANQSIDLRIRRQAIYKAAELGKDIGYDELLPTLKEVASREGDPLAENAKYLLKKMKNY